MSIIGKSISAPTSGLKSIINATAPTGSTVTCTTPAGVVLTATETSGTWTFANLTTLGTYTVNASLGTEANYENVVVDVIGKYDIEIQYWTTEVALLLDPYVSDSIPFSGATLIQYPSHASNPAKTFSRYGDTYNLSSPKYGNPAGCTYVRLFGSLGTTHGSFVLEFPKQIKLTKIENGTTYDNYYCSGYTVHGSNDNSTWDLLLTVTSVSFTNRFCEKSIPTENIRAYKYIKITTTSYNRSIIALFNLFGYKLP